MTEQNTEIKQTPEELDAEELRLLKERADLLGVPYKSNTRLDTLRERVKEVIEGGEKSDGAEDPTSAGPAKESPQQLRDRLQAESLVLVRCRIHNLNPMKRDLEGEIVTVANRYIGTVSKFIPFGEATDNGYHIPKIILDDLRARQFQTVSVKKNARGHDEVVRRMVPEYNVEIMPALTPDELEQLALKQAAAERLGA